MEINLLDRDRFAESIPHEWFTWLREHDPVHFHEEPDGPGFWVVSRHADIVAVNRDAASYSSDALRGGVLLGGAVRELDPHATGSVEARHTVVDGRAGIAQAVDGDRVVPAGRGLLVDALGDDRPGRGDRGLAGDGRGPPYLGDDVAAPDHHLGRDAAVVGALAAHQVLVDRDDPQAGLGGAGGERLPAGSGADDDQVHLVCAHGAHYDGARVRRWSVGCGRCCPGCRSRTAGTRRSTGR